MLIYFAYALSVGDQFELIGFLNGRSSKSFTHNSNNILDVLPKGTQGKVLAAEPLPSGNTALRVQVTSGDKKNKKFWIYYNNEKPLVKLFDQHNRETSEPAHAKTAQTKEDISVIRDSGQPEKAAVAAVEQGSRGLADVNSNDNRNSKTCGLCKVTVSDLDIPEPITDKVTSTGSTGPCSVSGANDILYQCSPTGSAPYSYFSLRERPNGASSNQSENYREFAFIFQDRARQDIHLFLTDRASLHGSDYQQSVLLFFPRKYLPKLDQVPDGYNVTLPNGETVKYDSKGKIVGGVLKENGEPSAASAPKVSYEGSGVMIRADSKGCDPRISSSQTPAGGLCHEPKATITKGDLSCQVDKKDLWPNSDSLVFKFETDDGFNSYLKSRCGFGF